MVPGLTWDRARALRLDEHFHPRIAGHVYAQPLYWRGAAGRPAILLLATEDNIVYAIDANTGAEVWKRTLGAPVARSSLPCGNIDPLGITGAPVIDESREAIYLDAAIETRSGPATRVFALSCETVRSCQAGRSISRIRSKEKISRRETRTSGAR